MELQSLASVAEQPSFATPRGTRTEERLVRMDELERLTGLRKTAIYAMQADGTFPKSVYISSTRVAWKLSEVMSWIESRPRTTGGKA